jgi:hypothetical protein
MEQVEYQIVQRERAELAAKARADEDTGLMGQIMNLLFDAVSKADEAAARQRVEELRARHPDASVEELVRMIVRQKVRQTGVIGAATAGASIVPGLGTLTSLTVGVAADIGATFKLQSEMVLEIAAAHNYPLNRLEKQRIVALVTGVSAGGNQLLRKGGQEIAERLARDYATRIAARILPVVGVIGSAGTNALSTYVIGQRAHAYFGMGPEAVGSWSDSLRAITGVNEREILEWLAGTTESPRGAIARGARRLASIAGEVAGTVVDAGKHPIRTISGATRRVRRIWRRGEDSAPKQLPATSRSLEPDTETSETGAGE